MPGQDCVAEEVPSSQEMWQLFKEQQEEFKNFRSYVRDNMVPIKEIVFAPKRLDQREREIEVERATRSYRNPGDKRAVAFLADLKIDIRERQEAIKDLNKCRVVDEDGELGDFAWDRAETRKKFTAFVEYVAEEAEKGRRKMIEQWDHYAIARDSKFGWRAVDQFKRYKTVEHGEILSPLMSSRSLPWRRRMTNSRRRRRIPSLSRSTPPLEGKLRDQGRDLPPASHPSIGTR